MAKKSFWLAMSGAALALGLIFSGCATNVATSKGTNFERKPMWLVNSPNYTLIGTVSLEKNWFGVLGVTTPTIATPLGPINSTDMYLFQSGGVTYVDLLEAARKQYPDADAVIDINIDYQGSYYGVFYSQRKNIVSGFAIKYSRDEVVPPPPDTK